MSLASYRNPCGLSADDYSTLDKILQKLRDSSPSTADAVTRYLIDGDGEAEVLANLPQEGGRLRLLAYGDRGDVVSWRVLFRDWDVPPAFYQRLVKVFGAAARAAASNMFFCQQAFGDRRGLEVLLQEVTHTYALSYVYECHPRRRRLTYATFSNLAQSEGCSADDLLCEAFREPVDARRASICQAVFSLPGFEAAIVAQRERIAPLLVQGAATARINALASLRLSGAPVEPFTAEIVSCATAAAKTLREASEPLLPKCGARARTELERVAREGDRGAREAAVRALGRHFREASADFLRTLADGEKSEAILEAIRVALGQERPGESGESVEVVLPPNRPLDPQAPVTPALRDALARVEREYGEWRDAHLKRLAAASPAKPLLVGPTKPLPTLPSDWLERVVGMLEGREPVRDYSAKTLAMSLFRSELVEGAHGALVVHPDFQLMHLVRWLAMAGELAQHLFLPIPPNAQRLVETYRAAHSPPLTLSELAEAVAEVGFSKEVVLEAALYEFGSLGEWDADSIWPFVWTQQAKLKTYLQPVVTTDYRARWDQEAKRNGAWRLLAKCPAVPPMLVDIVWDTALGTNKQERQRAQPICERLPDLAARLTGALQRGNAHVRQVAAEWAGRLGDRALVAPLTAAADKEKQDLALDAQLAALERFGESIERFLDRDKLQAESIKNLKKGLPPALDWFPWATLPALHWRDSGEAVPAETLRWLIVQSFKLKSPEPGALLKRYCQLLRPEDRAALGDFVLAAWLAQDLKRKLTDTEARAKAQQLAQQQWPWYQASFAQLQAQNQPIPATIPRSLQACEDLLFAQYQREVGTAVAEKGILAVAGACCGDGAVGPVQAYLKEWYGYRAAQCKALIAMLSAIDRPLAIQFLLSISNRFRTKGIREEAEKYVQLLADRKGWSLDELSDRTMPTCGLDEHGCLTLDFGPRQFTIRVDARLEPHLFDADGKPLKKLPDPRQDDDPQLAAAAKKTFAALKTELKKFVELTAGRMYEAMCTERRWSLADWQMYLLAHPLAKFLCQRLVWAADRAGGPATTFRPLDDGTLTDCEDNLLELPADATIRLAHASHVPRELREAWTRHCADYDVTPLFPQFAREPFELPGERGRDKEFKDYTGYMLEAFKLRGLATKLGYVRGATEDGGWFYEYLKSFPGLGVEVHLGFSGNGLPEENRTVALTTLTFQRKADPAAPQRRAGTLPLKDVPQVLLSECVGDLRALAAAGTGFDAQWENKVR